MKTTKTVLLAASAIIIAACSSSKKSSTSTTTSNSAVPEPLVFAKAANGVYAPGDEELAAIQEQYKDVTLEKLKQGHFLYAQGACIKCHGAQNIYRFGETQWKNIIDDMALRAKISDTEKDAVYKYVLAIKAVQVKEAK